VPEGDFRTAEILRDLLRRELNRDSADSCFDITCMEGQFMDLHCSCLFQANGLFHFWKAVRVVLSIY